MSCDKKIPNNRLVPRGTPADSGKVVSYNANGKPAKTVPVVTEVIDNLSSTETTKALSAKQGKVLNDLISDIEKYEVVEVTAERIVNTDIKGKLLLNRTGLNYSVTIQDNDTVPLPIHFKFFVCRTDSGNLPVTGSAGVTIIGANTSKAPYYLRSKNVIGQFTKLTDGDLWLYTEAIGEEKLDEVLEESALGIFIDQGNFAVSNNTYPTFLDTLNVVPIQKGFLWTTTGSATYNGAVIPAGSTMRAIVDNPGQTHANWAIGAGNLGYTPENVVNKATNFTSPDNTKYPTTLAVKAELDTKTNKLISIVQPTSNYTLSLSDADKLINMDVATANSLIIPNDSSVAFPNGTQVLICQFGNGQTTLTADTGVTIYSYNNALKLSGKYASVSIFKVDANTWLASGSLIP